MSPVFRAGWGNLAQQPPAASIACDWRFAALPEAGPKGMLAAGMGRSYGDVGLNSGGTRLCTRTLDRFIAFDRTSGRLECEAGVTVGEVLRVVLPHGWFLPVVPGTQWVTLGGAVACDIHGKNHVRAGTFGCHVREIELLRSDRARIACSETREPELFRATIGGLGLTGLITRLVVQMQRVPGPGMQVEELAFASLGELQQLIAESEGWEYSVAWVDSSRLGRGCQGVLSRAEHCAAPVRARETALAIPLTLPFSLVNDTTARSFSRLYAALQRTPRRLVLDHVRYFFPLDGLRNWNRVYGARGFFQYQCVIPAPDAGRGVEQLLAAVHAHGPASALIVLKDFGPLRSPGLLSFPRTGLTLAMDFPNCGERVRALFARLDAIVRAHGGALYPAKDACMQREMFMASFPQHARFSAQVDPAFRSNFWRRVQ